MITVAEPETGNPDVLVKWFYPGSTIGHEFIYPAKEEHEISHAKLQTFEGNHSVLTGEASGE